MTSQWSYHTRNLRQLRELLLDLLLQQIREKRIRTWRKLPVSCGEDSSVKLCLGKLDGYITGTWQISARKNQGRLFFTTSQSCSDLGVDWTEGFWALVSCISVCFPGCIAVNVVHRLSWFHYLSLTSVPHSVGLAPCVGVNVVTLRHRLMLNWLHFFIHIKCEIFLVWKDICGN
jgi:hypothetical protein